MNINEARIVRETLGEVYTADGEELGHVTALRASYATVAWNDGSVTRTHVSELLLTKSAQLVVNKYLIDPTQAGYICKRCGGPSPLGIGYVDHTVGAEALSAGRTRCDCGYSGRV